MPGSKSGNTPAASGHSGLTLLTLFALVTIGGAAVVGFLFRQTIFDAVNGTRDQVLTTVGLGFIPISLWLGAFVFALVFRRSALGSINLWLASVAAVLAIVGTLSFFRPFDGALGWFTGYGYSTLGGSLGDAVIGSPNWLGVLRVSALAILASAIALPFLAFIVGGAIAQGLGLAYLTALMGIRSLFSRRQRAEEPADLPPLAEAPVRPSFLMDGYGSEDNSRPGWDDRDDVQESYEDSAPVTSFGGFSEEPEESLSSSRTTFTVPDDWSYSGANGDESAGRTLQDDFEDEPEPIPAPAFASASLEEDFGRSFEPDPPIVQEPAFGRAADSVGLTDFTEPSVHVPSEAAPAVGVQNAPVAPSPARKLLSKITGGGLMWQRPAIGMLKQAPEMSISSQELKDTAETITQTLGEYGVEVEVGHVRPGPTVTMYGLVPGWIRKSRVVKQLDKEGTPLRDESGRQITKREENKTRVKVDSILAREKDLALALRTPSIRIETPAMGKSLVGIEVPNPNPSLVTLRNVMESREFQKLRKDAHLPVALGRGSGGEAVSFDLAKMPHLLVAGATGSGKSVCLNAIVSCLITEKTPVEARLLLVDPKRVELTPYNGIPHLMAPVVVETDTVVGYLKGLIREMFDRYRQMEEVGVRNIEAYNKRMPDNMPYLCVVIDELADLMMTASFDIEQSLCRLAQLGRATGIHLIIATQRPSVDVLTGLIKANFPSRISFGVTSQVDSRTILDTAGADKLLGRGDMLYLPLDASKPARVQSVFIGDDEIGDIVDFWKKTPWPPLREIDLLGGEGLDEHGNVQEDDSPDRDDMFNKALELAQSHRKLSTSLLQRRLRIGYPRAARLMDQLEEEGIVGPSDGSKSRDVIINQA